MATTITAPSTTTEGTQRLMAQTDIGAAWESHKKDGLEFGRVCYGWSQRLEKSKGGYGSKGEGQLGEILRVLDIPDYIVKYWISRYKASIGEGIPCSLCTDTFPSKTQLKKHQRKDHQEFAQPIAPVYPISDYSKHPEAQATTGSRSHGMGLDRLRKQAEEAGIACTVSYTDDSFTIKHDDVTQSFPEECDAREFLKSLAVEADQTATPCAPQPTAAPSKPKQIHVSGDENAPIFWKTLGNKLNALLPSYSDGSEHTMVSLLEQAYTEPLSKDATVLKSIVVMLKKISSEYAEHAQKLEARMKFDEIAEIVQVEEQMAPPSGGVSIPTSPLHFEGATC